VGISLWTSCVGALPLICEGSAKLRVCVDPFQTIGLKRKSDCVPWFGHFFLGVVEPFL